MKRPCRLQGRLLSSADDESEETFTARYWGRVSRRNDDARRRGRVFATGNRVTRDHDLGTPTQAVKGHLSVWFHDSRVRLRLWRSASLLCGCVRGLLGFDCFVSCRVASCGVVSCRDGGLRCDVRGSSAIDQPGLASAWFAP